MKAVLQLLPLPLKIINGILIVVAVIGAFLAALIPSMLGAIIDGLISEPTTISEKVMPFVFMIIFVEILAIIRRVLSDIIAVKYGEIIINKNIKRLLQLSKQTLEDRFSSGEISKKADDAADGATKLLKLATNDIVPTLFLGAFTIYQCFKQSSSALFVVIMVLYIVFTLAFSLLQIRSQKGIRIKIINKKQCLTGELTESIQGIEQIRALGAESAERNRLEPLIKTICRIESKHHVYMGLWDAIKQITKAIFTAVILFVGISCIIQGDLSSGALVAIVLLFNQLQQPISEIYRFIDDISEATNKLDVLGELTSSENDYDENKTLDDKNPHCVFKENEINIPSYEMRSTHGEAKIISKGKEILLRQGVSTAIDAKSGGGKSSLFRGIMRIYPIEGKINLFGVNSELVSNKQLIDAIHYVPQNPFFFKGALRDNLAYGLTDYSDEKLIEALKKACLYEEIKTKENNPLDMEITTLSGGEKRRLAIARAFLRKPRLFFFDETFAEIDSETLKKLLSNLDDYARQIGAGIVHVSHESQIKERCDEKIELSTLS